MGKNKKSRNQSDFAKPKRTPGKVLKKTNVTDTTFKTRQVVLLNQLQDKEEDALPTTSASQVLSKVSITEICQRLNHFQESALRSGLEALLTFYAKDKETFYRNLNKIIPSVGRLLGWDGFTQKSSLACLAKAMSRICSVPDTFIYPHFDRLCSFIALGLSNVRNQMKLLTLKILRTCMLSMKLAPSSKELFNCFMRLIACDCLTGKIPGAIISYALQTLPEFLHLYLRNKDSEGETKCLELKVADNQLRVLNRPPPPPDPYNFPVIGPAAVKDSPVSSKKGLIICADAVYVFLARVLSFEDFPLQNYVGIVSSCLKKINVLVTDYVQRHAIPSGIYGRKFKELAKRTKLLTAVSKDRKLMEILEELFII